MHLLSTTTGRGIMAGKLTAGLIAPTSACPVTSPCVTSSRSAAVIEELLVARQLDMEPHR